MSGREGVGDWIRGMVDVAGRSAIGREAILPDAYPERWRLYKHENLQAG